MSEKFTPGPWLYDYENDVYCGEIIGADGRTICSFADEPSIANAHLIAAAPEMHEALRAVDAWENPSCFKKVKEALKKARGEE